MADDATDDRLIAALDRARGEALGVLVRRHTPFLYSAARRLAVDAGAADDLLQETWLRLLRQPPRLGPGQSALPWLRRVLVRLAIDQARARGRRRTEPGGLDPVPALADPAPAPEAALLHADVRRRVRAALDRLPPGYREILVLLHGEGWSVAEVASALAVPKSVVKNRAMRGRRRLRALLVEDAKGEAENHATSGSRSGRECRGLG